MGIGSINVQTFATDLLNTVDYVINGFVQTGYHNLVANNQTEITMVMTFYIAWLGYKFMTHTLEMEVNTLARHLGLLILVYALISNWQLYDLFFYNIFTNEPGQIAQTMANTNGSNPYGAEPAATALNTVFSQGMSAAEKLFEQFNITNRPPLLEGIMVLLATAANCLIALAILVYAKMGTALALFLGPIFLLFLLFAPTREFFNKWLQKLMNYAFIPIITCGILMLTLSIANYTLPGLMQTANQGNAAFSGVLIYFGVSMVSILLYFQILPICAALSGGMALAGLSLAIPLAKKAMEKSGMSALASRTGGAIGQGISTAQNRLSQAAQQRSAARAKAASDKKFGSGSGRYY